MKHNPIIAGIFVSLLLVVACTSNVDNSNSYEIDGTQKRKGEDPYQTDLYWSLNESPMQKKLRNIKPFPVGVVYYQQRGENLDSVVQEFKTIKDLGFTALKQVQIKAPYNPPDFQETVFNKALDIGISPWYYGKGGWEAITQELVDSLGIDMQVNDKNMPKIQEHPKMVKYQTQMMRQRIEKLDKKPERPEGMGEPGRNNPWLPERLIPHFAKWLNNTYGTVDSLKKAWNHGFIRDWEFTDFQEAARFMKGSGFNEYGQGTGTKTRNFRPYRDAMRFQADLIIRNYDKTMTMYTQWDSVEPERTGGHQLFENQAMNTWDLQGQAESAAIGGSFYASIHLPHHFFLVNNETVRPVYMQARIVADMFKGGWAATWESTGGPTQWSGYEGFTVDDKKMKQLMLSYIASGLKGIGFWMWNSRGEGWEAAEYALTDHQLKPGERAKTAGHISEIIQDQRFELWEALDEPTVGVLYSWENEALLGRLSLGTYELDMPVYETKHDARFRQYHSEAKIGISRALMNNNIPYEYVTARNVQSGLAERYPVIYLPYTITLQDKTIKRLKKYVKNGGHLVADFPVLMFDTYGRLRRQMKGSMFEELFGFQTADYYNTFNRSKSIDGIDVKGQYGDIKLTDAKVIKEFQDGSPAIMQSSYGEGQVTVFNFEAGRMMYEPGRDKLEDLVTYHTLGDVRPPFDVKNAGQTMVFRRSAPEADHYIAINPGSKEEVGITSGVIDYTKARELISDSGLNITNNTISVEVPKNSGVWIRCEKE